VTSQLRHSIGQRTSANTVLQQISLRASRNVVHINEPSVLRIFVNSLAGGRTREDLTVRTS